MRSVPARSRPRLPRFLAASAVLALGACGGGEPEHPAAPAVVAPGATPDATPAAATGDAPAGDPGAVAADPNAIDPNMELRPFVPFEMPIEGSIEYEEAESKPLSATFTAPPATERPAVKDLPPDDPILGQPLVINGEVVPFEEVKKQICLGAFGNAALSDARIAIFIAEEQKRLKDAGAPPERMELQPNEVEDYLATLEKNIKAEFPEGGYTMADYYKGLATDDPRKKFETQMLFSKLYMPDDPALFPPLSLEAILKNAGGQEILDYYKQLYDQRQTTPGAPRDPDEYQFDAVVMQQIVSHLTESATIERDPAPGILCRINGVDVKTDDIWACIQARVTKTEVLLAKQWIVNMFVLKKAFVDAGAWMSDEEADAAYFAHVDPYRDSIFNLERVAVMVKQFPSVEYYKQYRRMYECFARLKAPSKEELAKHAEYRSNKVIGQVSVDVDVLLCSAFDFKTNSWKENGWVEAGNRMKDVLNLLIEEQRPWDEMVEKYSDFYEPPVPVSQRGSSEPDPFRRGRFRNIQRNVLIAKLGESDYRSFLSGRCITDFIFFDQEVGTLGDPMAGPWGWYMPRLLRRTKAPKRITMEQETLDALVLDDYITTQLNAFTQEQIRKNEVYGLERPGAEAK